MLTNVKKLNLIVKFYPAYNWKKVTTVFSILQKKINCASLEHHINGDSKWAHDDITYIFGWNSPLIGRQSDCGYPDCILWSRWGEIIFSLNNPAWALHYHKQVLVMWNPITACCAVFVHFDYKIWYKFFQASRQSDAWHCESCLIPE